MFKKNNDQIEFEKEVIDVSSEHFFNITLKTYYSGYYKTSFYNYLGEILINLAELIEFNIDVSLN